MKFDPNNRDAMDESQTAEEIADFLDGAFFNEEPVPAEPEAEAAQTQLIQELPVPEPVVPETVPAAPQPRTTRKRRPKRKKTYNLFGLPQLLATAVWLALIVVIGVTLGRFMWVCAADVLAFGRADKEVTVTISADDDLGEIIDKLQDEGLIRYPWLFKIYADLSHAEEDMETGTFTLNTNYDYHALVNELSSGSSRAEVTVQIPEGYNCRQIFQLLEEKGVATVAALEEFAANGELDDYWFLENVQRGDKYSLEGFLFPDTYNFYAGGGAEHALRKLLNGFENKFDEDMQASLDALNTQLAEKMRANGESDDYVVSHMFTVKDVVIVASLIEEEASSSSESPNIASVIYNRLFSWGSNPRYLNIDAALVYALGRPITGEDTQYDSPYNTYMYTGLTPTPISNPGMSSIDAALNPASTKYFYYVLNPSSGKHEFSTNYDDHAALVAKYSEVG